MTTENRKHKMNTELVNPAEWLERVLSDVGSSLDLEGFLAETSEVPEAFLERCRQAAECAAMLAKLRKERRRVGFVPVSLAEYVQDLAKMAGVPLPKVLARHGIADISSPGPRSGKAIARLARELGLGLREALVHVRIGFAERCGLAPVPLLMASRRTAHTSRSLLDHCETVLEQLESACEPYVLNELHEIESELRAAYKADGEAL